MEPMHRPPPTDFDSGDDFFSGVWKIALGIFVGGLLLWACVELRTRYELHRAQQAMSAFVSATAAAVDEATARSRRREADKLAAQRSAQIQREKLEVARREKEAAWQKFFQPSPVCLNSTSVECGNAYIRARREFERRYAAGEI